MRISSVTALCRAILTLSIGAALTLATSAYGDISAGDVTFIQETSAKAVRGSYDRRTSQVTYTATLINLTDTYIIGPLYVHVSNISQPDVIDVNHDDVFTDGRGLYLVNINLAPDEVIKKDFTFTNPLRKKFLFDVEMWVDSSSNPDVPPAD